LIQPPAELYRQVFAKDVLLDQIRRDLRDFPVEKVHSVGHHLAHAASAAFTSGWDECLVVVNDAMGEIQSLTVYRAKSGKLAKLAEISASDSIGILYSLVTLHLDSISTLMNTRLWVSLRMAIRVVTGHFLNLR